MESKCDYFMYFPSAPITSSTKPAEYTSLPRRKHVYLGETVQLLFILRHRAAAGKLGDGVAPWKHLANSLSARASVCAAERRTQTAGAVENSFCEEEESSSGESEDGSEGSPGWGPDCNLTPRQSSAPLIHNSPRDRPQHGGEAVTSPVVLDDQVIFCLTVSLDKLPVDTFRAKIVVTVWRQEEDRAEAREHGYLTLLQLRSPAHTFKQDLSCFKAQVSAILNVLPPPSVQYQQMTISGKHLIVLKVLNCSSQEEVCIRDMKILPNYNSSFLPIMPDGSVLIVDNVCHQSAEVTTASFYRRNSGSSRLPSTLSALEEQSFLFQLQLQDKDEEDSSEGMEVPLVAEVQWCTSTLPYTRYISSCYSLSSIRLDRPRLLMTASCVRSVRPLEPFWVKYTLLNNLQDFLAVRLIWNSEVHRKDQLDSRVTAVVCRTPFNHLGECRKGSTISFTVAFQILRAGLFELNQHMKLKLQFTASMSPHSPQKSSQLSSDAPFREQQEKQSLGRSKSFSHQNSTKSHHIRSGSAMAWSAILPAVESPKGSPLHLPPAHTTIPLEKIAKRECKVLVVEPTQEAQRR
ncbi:trafficking protein particle complex subunit 14-like [Nelusetta ayraudi]|uniref:trafficking protein particle complex subunit 14-like n=1 Tax=Nelusetta ayraudi TaxID=303726 RepID=UPI003F6F982B